MRSNQLSYPAICFFAGAKVAISFETTKFFAEIILICTEKVVILHAINAIRLTKLMEMRKQRLEIEYPLETRSSGIVWSLISTDHGLGRWIADSVTEEDGHVFFTWGQPWAEHHTMEAMIEEREPNSHIRFRWVEDEDPDAFWEMRIGSSELTGLLCLYVTDYAWAEDLDDLRSLWDGNMERLHQSSGL